jgi:hypothetical protein
MRVLLETGQAANRVICMALDIAEGSGTQRRLFVLEPANGQVNKLAGYLQPELPLKAHSLFVSELSSLLGISPQRVFVKNWTEPFPCESVCEDDLLRSIDEAV